jgi:hypothetical protein
MISFMISVVPPKMDRKQRSVTLSPVRYPITSDHGGLVAGQLSGVMLDRVAVDPVPLAFLDASALNWARI